MTWPTFASPLLAGVAAAIAIPTLLILYFLKLRRRNVDVSTTLLWKRAVEDLQANAPFQKLRKNILLLLQLIALALALLALAQPMLSSEQSPPPRSIIMIDRSASMGAVDAPASGTSSDTTRLARAKQEALAFVDAMSEGGTFGFLESLVGRSDADEAMVIAFDSSAQVIQPFTSNKAQLRAAIESIAPSGAETSIENAMKIAGPYAAERFAVTVDDQAQTTPGVPVVLWSDGAIPDLRDAGLPNGLLLEYRRVGRANTANIGITAMRAARTYDRPDRVSVFVGLQSTGPARTVDVSLAIDSVLAGVRSVELPAATADGPGTGGVVFSINRADGATLAASLDLGPDDALSIDNDAWTVLPPARALRVALVGDVDIFMRNVLRALKTASSDAITLEEFDERIANDQLGEFDVYVVKGWRPNVEEDGGASLPPGRFIFIGSPPPVAGVRERRREEPSVEAFVAWERDHPALRYVDLDAVRLSAPPLIDAGNSADILASSTAGPAILEISRGPTRALIVGFDPLETNWPFERSFPLFFAQAVRYLGDELSDLGTPSARPGDVLPTRVPAGVNEITLTDPLGNRTTLQPGADGSLVVGPFVDTGVHTLSWDGPPGPEDRSANGRSIRLIASSLLSPAESRLGARDTLDLSQATVTARNAGADANDDTGGNTPLWPWLLIIVLLVVLVEWYVYNRKVYV